MTYITGTLTDANAPATLYGAAGTANTVAFGLTSAGYTLVDTVVISTRTHKIWLSPAAANSSNKDWYLDVAYTTTGAGFLWFTPFEFFDPATDLAYRGPAYSGSTVVDPATGTRFGATGQTLENTGHSPIAGDVNTAVGAPATSFGYWISLTANRVAALSSAAPGNLFYTGLYEPDPLYAAKAGAGLFPLCIVNLDSTGTPAIASARQLNRIWPFTSLSAGGWNATGLFDFAGAQTGLSLGYPKLPSGTTVAYPYVMTRIVAMGGSSSVAPARWGFLWDVGALPTVGVVRGDTFTVSGNPWVASTTGGNMSIALRAF